MPLVGDVRALEAFEKRLRKLSKASQEVARALQPRTAKLVQDTVRSQASPEGAPWPATKSGAPAFGGGDASGRVLSRLAGKLTVITTVLHPLHFHQEGTHAVGRKRGAAVKRAVISGYASGVLRSMGLRASAPRQRKGESDEAYRGRMDHYATARAAKSEARKVARRHAEAAYQEARAAGGIHDPPRPMLPQEGSTPAAWVQTIERTAREVLDRIVEGR